MGLTTGNMLQNRYRVVSKLGQGGMGAVYRAWDTRLKIPIALKEMTPQPGLDAATLAQLRQQFEQEAAVLARLQHPHLVRVTDFFEESGNAYLAMDFVEGENLAARIEREGTLPEQQVLAWAHQLLDALAYCHAQGVLHRDIKPQNVIIRPDGRAVLVDFGLVKLWDPNDPRTRTAMRGMGTPEYAPPEQYEAAAGHTTPASDVYSLGATLYHALAGQAPPTATLRMADPTQFVPLRELVPYVSPQTETAIDKAMALVRSQRWASAQEMAQALGRGPAPTYQPVAPVTPQRQPVRASASAGAQPATGRPATAPPAAKPTGRISRRGFLYGALAVGGAIVGCGGIGGTILVLSQLGGQSPVDTAATPTAKPRPTNTRTPVATKAPTPTGEPTEPPPPPPPETTHLRWFVGAGGNPTPGEIEAEETWIRTFNARQDEIALELELANYDTAPDQLWVHIAAGDAPDVVGPLGVARSAEFYWEWLGLEPYLSDSDLDDFNWGALVVWADTDRGLIGLPVSIWPSALYVNVELFDAMGFDYGELPQIYSERYDWWTVELLEELAMVLTIDANGNDAYSDRFDPENIAQFGYVAQWTSLRGLATLFGAGTFSDGRGNAFCPENWWNALRWYYDGMWGKHFIPNSYYQNDMMGGHPFGSGIVAMAYCHLWLTCCITDTPSWDYVAVPFYNGIPTAKLHTDAIGVLQHTDYPEAAVQAAYAIASSRDLVETWVGTIGLPARQSLHDDAVARLDEQFPHGVNWDTIIAGADYPDVPNHERYLPNPGESNARINDFYSLLHDTPDLDVDAEIEQLLSDLQGLFEAADY